MGDLTAALAQKVATSRASGGGNVIKDGRYVFLIKKAFVDQKFKGTTFIAELDVIVAEKTHDTIEPNKEGSSASYVLNLDQNVSAPGNLKQMILALIGKEESELTPDQFATELNRVIGTAQAGRGMYIAAETYRKTTQKGANAGKEGVYPRWSTVSATEGNADTDITTRRAKLDAEKK